MDDIDSIISLYFVLGLSQLEILCCLRTNHDIVLSPRTLKRKLQILNLHRRKCYSNIFRVARFIEENIRLHSQLHGYRWMHLKCLQNGFTVTQNTVRHLLNVLDPEGVSFRRRKRLRRRQYSNKGPNFLWHMDCYDKLKPFGICISGCIDGFSRSIIWLKAGKNTSDPKVICQYYLQAVETLAGCPRTVRADLGTENGLVEELQRSLREIAESNIEVTQPPFLYGASPANQRIEAWWSILRKHHPQYWINIFQSLRDDGYWSGCFLDRSLIQFCFLQIIQKELDTVVTEWNMHRITSSRNSIAPRGRPFIMYNMPQVYGVRDYSMKISQDDIAVFCELYEPPPNYQLPCDHDVYHLAAIIMDELHLTFPQDPNGCIDLYKMLRTNFQDLL